MRASSALSAHPEEVARLPVGDQVGGIVEERVVDPGRSADVRRIHAQVPEDLWNVRDRGDVKRRYVRRAAT